MSEREDYELTNKISERGIGDNRPPIAERLPLDYEKMLEGAETIALKANDAPEKILDDEQLAFISQVVKDARAMFLQADEAHKIEKAPFLEGGRAVDAFFNGVRERMTRIASSLTRRVQAYQDALREAARKKAQAEEEERRRAELKRQQEAEERARKAREEEERKLAAARAAEERGRKADAEKRRQEAEAARVAAEEESKRREREAADHRANEAALREKAEQDEQQAARVRTSAGVATSVGRWEGTITDWEVLDLNQLKPHFSRPDVEKAIRAYVRTHQDTRPLAGLSIRREAKAVIK